MNSRISSEIDLGRILGDVRERLKEGQLQPAMNLIADLHPADIAELISRLDDEGRRAVFQLLEPETASEVLVELDEAVQEDVLEGLDSRQIARLVDRMDSDDAADIVSDLPADQATEVLEHVEEESSEEIQELLQYAEDTAGGIMAKEYVAVHADCTVSEAIEEIRRKYHDVEEMYYCYVIDDFGTLLGMISLRDLIISPPDAVIRDIMEQDIVVIDSDLDQEEVARMFKKYDLVAAPVVNRRHKLIGRITIDDVVDVIDDEMEEDLGRIAGTGEEEVLEDSVVQISRARLPWLLLSFSGEILSAFIMKSFEATIQQIIASAFFIPLVMATGGSAGQQSSIIVVRGLVTGEIGLRDTRMRLKRELFVAFLNGTILALLIFSVIALWNRDYAFGLLLGFTMVVIISNASVFGAVIPLFFKRIHIDPALATGPFVATFNDVVGLVIYFSMLTLGFEFLI